MIMPSGPNHFPSICLWRFAMKIKPLAYEPSGVTTHSSAGEGTCGLILFIFLSLFRALSAQDHCLGSFIVWGHSEKALFFEPQWRRATHKKRKAFSCQEGCPLGGLSQYHPSGEKQSVLLTTCQWCLLPPRKEESRSPWLAFFDTFPIEVCDILL